MNNAKIFVPQKSQKWGTTTPLPSFVRANSKNLNRYNMVYVIQSNAEPDIFKIGKSWGTQRLSEYISFLGPSTGSGGGCHCSGSNLWYLGGVVQQEHASFCWARRDVSLLSKKHVV